MGVLLKTQLRHILSLSRTVRVALDGETEILLFMIPISIRRVTVDGLSTTSSSRDWTDEQSSEFALELLNNNSPSATDNSNRKEHYAQ